MFLESVYSERKTLKGYIYRLESQETDKQRTQMEVIEQYVEQRLGEKITTKALREELNSENLEWNLDDRRVVVEVGKLRWYGYSLKRTKDKFGVLDGYIIRKQSK
jgi:hypothetical protein